MNEKYQKEIAAHLDRADESIEAAKELLKNLSLANFRICRRKSLSDRKNRFSIPQNCFLDENYLKIRPKSPKKCQTQVKKSHYDFAASRAYYAVFYASSALLLKEGLEFGKHSGVIAAIHQKFIKIGEDG